MHLEADPVDRGEVAVHLPEALDADDRVPADGSSLRHDRMVPRIARKPVIGCRVLRTSPSSRRRLVVVDDVVVLDRILVAEPLEVERDRQVGGRPVRGRLRRRGAELDVRLDRPVEPDVAPGRLRQVPLLLEDVAVGLDEVAAGPDGAGDPGERRPVHVAQPAVRGLLRVDPPAAVVLEPRLVLVQVVEQQLGLALERPDPRPPLDLAGVEAAGRDVHPQPDPVVAGVRVDRQVDGVAEVVQPPHPGPDRLAVAGPQDRLVVELRPDGPVRVARPLGGGDRLVRVRCALHRREVGQAERDVLDEDLGVVLALAVGQRRMDLARLGVDEIRLDPVAVAAEQRVGQRAVAPVDAVAVEVDEEERHRVEEPVAVDARAGRQAHQQPAVLQRVGEILRRQDRHRPLRDLGQAGRGDRRQRRRLEVEQDFVLPPAGRQGQLLERVQGAVGGQEADQVARRPDRQLPEREVLLGPVGERRLPREIDERDRRIAEQEPGKGGHRWAVESIGARGEPADDQVLVRAASSDRPRPTRRSRATRTGGGRRAGGGRR